MKDTQYILDVRNLVIHYEMDEGVVEAVNNISLQLKYGETLGLVGETGAGKTTIALSIMGLLPKPPSHILQGEIYWEGKDLLRKSKGEMRNIRGKQISMIFQDPMTALNPVLKIGKQVEEVIELHLPDLVKSEVEAKAKEALAKVGIQEDRYNDYPHEFSGGMKQRVIIAISLASRPALIIADEPTTALDVTIQAQVLNLISDLQSELNTAMLLITHDFGIVAETCDRCAVIYAGEIVESGSLEHLFDNPKHPYTIGLFRSVPNINQDVKRLSPIPGLMADPMNLPTGCSFYNRCENRDDQCKEQDPQTVEIEPGHLVKCIHIDMR